jgi:hypothetical protein
MNGARDTAMSIGSGAVREGVYAIARAAWTALVVFVLSYIVIAGTRLPFTRLDRPDEAARDAVRHDTILLLPGV